jgi:hypothetical protein
MNLNENPCKEEEVNCWLKRQESLKVREKLKESSTQIQLNLLK